MDSSQSVTGPGGQTYPCHQDANGLSWWYVGGGCYSSQAAQPWPAAGDKAWAGHTPADNGIIVNRSCNLPPSLAASYLTWERCIANCQNFNPQTLINELSMGSPVITMSPASGAIGFVHQNVWFWSTTDMSDKTMTWNSGANVMIGTRTLTGIDWDYGDGTTAHTATWPNCPAYANTDGSSPAPAGCGHTYTKPSVNPAGYTITVTAHWTYQFTFNGAVVAGGVVPNIVPRTATIIIKEAQSTNG